MLPEGLPPDAAQPLFRAFGLRLEDLDVDFQQLSTLHLVTQILSACHVRADAENGAGFPAWDWSVGLRTACLLEILAASGMPTLEAVLRCQNQGCGEQLGVEIAVKDLVTLQNDAERHGHMVIESSAGPFTLRRPTGRDQAAWQNAQASGEAALLSLLQPGPGQPDVRPPLEGILLILDETMETFDPLVNFHVQTACPYCGQAGLHALDLLEFALSALRGIQQRVQVEIHRLAHAYHWSEEEILRIPAWRRDGYLALLDQERYA
jgi:hypothetical protein